MSDQPQAPVGAQSEDDLELTTIPAEIPDGVPVPSQDPEFEDDGEEVDDGDAD